MKKLLLLLLLLPLGALAQNITGKWQDKNLDHVSLEFKADGTLIMADTHDAEGKKAKNIKMTYRTVKEGGKDKIEVEVFFNGKSMQKGKLEYSIKGNTLFISSEFEGNGKVGRTDEYVKVE